MTKKKLFKILVIILFVFFMAECFFDIDNYPNNHPNKLHKIITVSRNLNQRIRGVSIISISALIILYILSYYYNLSQKYVPFYFFLFYLIMSLVSIEIVLTLIGFIAFENRSLLQWIFPAPVFNLCFLITFIIWFQEERKRLR